jgi:hypothetical protein
VWLGGNRESAAGAFHTTHGRTPKFTSPPTPPLFLPYADGDECDPSSYIVNGPTFAENTCDSIGFDGIGVAVMVTC